MKAKYRQINDQLRVSLAGNVAVADFRAEIPSQIVGDDAKKVLGDASLWFFGQRANVQDNVETPAGRPQLTEDRYVYANFRALSETLLRNRGLDFSQPGVLKKAVPMLLGRTVYPNHDFADVNNWVGVVSQAKWDAKGEQSGGVPGINVEVKLDAFLNYRIACGVMMTPPAVNAMSLTVVFEFEYSHPQMAIENRWKFFENLGEEVDGQIVRMIVTKIVEFWEASLVSVGEDRLAKHLGGKTEDQTQSFSADPAEIAADDDESSPANPNEERNTMKLTKEDKARLGIEFDGEDVPDEQIKAAIDSLAEKASKVPANIEQLNADAEAGRKYVEQQRAEVTRLARIAELGPDDADGELDPVIADDIKDASFDRLTSLKAYYEKKVAAKFPKGGRSSLEGSEEIEHAGGVTAPAKPATTQKVGLH